MTQLIRYTVTELAEDYGCTLEEVADMYGEDAVAVYFAQRGNKESAVVGVQMSNGNYSAYGLRLDQENITYEQMIAIMERAF